MFLRKFKPTGPLYLFDEIDRPLNLITFRIPEVPEIFQELHETKLSIPQDFDILSRIILGLCQNVYILTHIFIVTKG